MERTKGEVSIESAPSGEPYPSEVNFSPWYRFLQTAFLWVYGPLIVIYNYLVFGLRFEGRENLKHGSGSGLILVSNHSLYLDPAVIIHALFPARAYYFALKSHFRHPVGGMLIRAMGGIPVPGPTGMRRAVNTTREALRRGQCVHLFPEGEMKLLNQDIAPFQSGAFYLALRSGAPIVTVTLAHRPRSLFGWEISPRFRQVRCIVGEPIDVALLEGEKVRDVAARIAAATRQEMAATITCAFQKS